MSSPLLAGKVISVTGAGSGIGRSCAIRLAQDGAKVSLTDMSSELLGETIELVCAVTSRENVSGRVLDIVDRQEVDAWVEETVRRFGKLDGAVNAAGVHPKESGKEPIWDVTDDDWAFAQDVNVKGTLNLVRARLKWMVGARDEAKGDSLESRSIVVFGSICSVKGGAKLAAYTASKHAVVGLMRAAAIDAAPHDIRVNAICP